MEELNRSLFLWINAIPTSPGWIISLAVFFARELIAIVPLLIVALWLWGAEGHVGAQRMLVIKTAIALLCAVVISWCMGNLFPHPRPFVIGLGHQYLQHSPDNSFPSNHGTAIFTFALAFLFWHRRWSGAVLIIIGLAIAWSRVYLGVHWPMDMVGGFLVAAIACLITQIVWHFCGQRLLQNILTLYRIIFAFPIRKGWVCN